MKRLLTTSLTVIFFAIFATVPLFAQNSFVSSQKLYTKIANIPGSLEDSIKKQFEDKRQAMIKLVNDLPEESFINADIESWLAADVAGHFDEHSVQG